MPSSSLIKHFSKVKHQDGRNLYWDRAGIDGHPYRGVIAPLMPEEEYESRTVRVVDAHNGFFDTESTGENTQFLEIIEACCNGWFQCLHLERFWRGTTKHYIEWLEYYMEDGHRVPYRPHGMVELPHGQGNGLQHPHARPG